MAAALRIGAIDDDRMLLEGTRRWFADIADIDVGTVSSTVEEFLAASDDEDVVLLDLRLADSSRPADNVSQLVRSGFKVLVVSVFAERDLMIATLRAGAKGYLTKDNDLDALATTIREIAADTHLLSQELAFAIDRDRDTSRPALSEQEHAVVRLYAQGLTLKAAAEQLHISFYTARGYLQRAKDKYQAVGRPFGSRTQLQGRLREDDLGPST